MFANWIPEKWEIFPYLNFYGISGTGKNQAWQTLSKISYHSIEAANITGAPLFRSVRPEIKEEKIQTAVLLVKNQGYKEVTRTIKVPTGENDFSTIFLDELGILNAQSSEKEQDKHQILDAGYKRDGNVIRCFGKDNEPKTYLVGGFKSLASVYSLPHALQSRCIQIKMTRTTKRFPIRWNESEVERIRKDLEIWRIYAKTNLPISLELDEFTEYLLFENCNDGRLVQLFYCLYRVAPLSVKPTIIDVLIEKGKQKIQTTAASFEAEIFSAVLDVYNNKPSAYTLGTTDITNAYNRAHDVPLKERTIQNQVGSLGFEPYRTAKVRGFINSKPLIDKLKNRFQIGQQTLETLPPSSPESVTSVTSVIKSDASDANDASPEEAYPENKSIRVQTLEEVKAQRAKEDKESDS